jgi:hypothetical protein
MRRLDDALGGAWWRRAGESRVTAQAVAALSKEFATRLSRDTGMEVVTVPVRRVPDCWSARVVITG